eukprot:jgi/Chrpa1/19351/Chrysochromulina_OHIO_Genome00026133-RA
MDTLDSLYNDTARAQLRSFNASDSVHLAAGKRHVGIATSATTGERFVAHRRRVFDGSRRNFAPTPVSSFLQQAAWLPECEGAKVAVCTTINEPTGAIEAVAKLDGWCVVVVGDRLTPDANYTNLVQRQRNIKFLSLDEQRSLPFELTALTREGHFSRKNLGFLYAASVGAIQIFDFDDDNFVIPGLALPSTSTAHHAAVVRTLLSSSSHGNSSARHTAHGTTNLYTFYNPMAHFKAPAMWPRGFPLAQINAALAPVRTAYAAHARGAPPASADPRGLTMTNVTRARKASGDGWSPATWSVGVIQSLADHDPDVDAIYRLGPRSVLTLPFHFTEGAHEPALVLAPHVYAPFNAQATIFSAEALWSCYLPASVHGRVSDIWRSYLAQRLFPLARLRLAFHAPFVTQYRNAHDYMRDYMSERPLYETTEELLHVLEAEWRPEGDVSIATNVESAYIALYEFGFVEMTFDDL